MTITFVGNTNRDALRTFGDTFAEGTSWWSKVTAGYGVGAATGGTHIELPDTVSNTTLDDDQSQTSSCSSSQAQVEAGTLPPPDANQVFVIYFPSTTTITAQGGGSCTSFGGYHSMSEITTDAGILSVPYAVIPDCGGSTVAADLASLQDTVSHEFIEASTDPYASQSAWGGYQVAWFRIPGGGTPVELGEVADACESYAPVTDPNGYTLTRSWVNQAAQASSDPCQPEQPGEIYYAVAVPTTTEVPSTPGYPKSDGYIVVPAGTTVTVDSVFFSEAKLPNDAQIQVGGRGSKGSTTLNPTIETGVTASVTPTAAHNGMHVTLTIQADATATNGDFSARVRSILKTGDQHDWPFLVRITGGAPPSDAGTGPHDAGGGG